MFADPPEKKKRKYAKIDTVRYAVQKVNP